MFFYMPVKVFQEQNCIAAHAEELAGLGNKAMIITGKRSSKENGSLADVTTSLEQNNTQYIVFDQVEENPSIETVMKARDIAIEQQIDFVIGIGGGSPLDAAKAIALMAANPKETQELLYEKRSANRALPVAAVPTTCGTGSETTPYAILTRHDKETKASISHHVFPEFAFVDGKYMTNMSHSVLAATAIDALGHFIESYVNVKATSFSRMLCEYGLKIWAKNKAVILGEHSAGEEENQDLLLASTIAGMAISHTGTSLPHGLSYKVTYNKGIPHGKAVGIFLAAYLELADKQDVAAILHATGFENTQKLSEFIQRAVGTVEVSPEFLLEGVSELISNEAKLANCPYKVDEKALEAIYRKSVILDESENHINSKR